MRDVRCAIYTRKSTEEGLDQEFNSLDAQRAACEAYIEARRLDGWILINDHYDDGGYSGGNMKRPQFQRLLSDIRDRKVDMVVCYKLDRLSRSLFDFSHIFNEFDKHGVSFSCVTQELNTATSTGRMVINLLMTFAQFERELCAERVSDKVAATRKKGLWTGGVIPYGYQLENRHLIIDPQTAPNVVKIFEWYLELGTPKRVARRLAEHGILRHPEKNKPWDTRMVLSALQNCIYIGQIPHKDKRYDGQHERIVSQEIWDKVSAMLQSRSSRPKVLNRSSEPALLTGLIRCGHCGDALSYTWTAKSTKGIRYGYYTCRKDMRKGISTCPIRSIAAQLIEPLVESEVVKFLRTRTMLRQISEERHCSQLELQRSLLSPESFWQSLTPVEKRNTIAKAVAMITVYQSSIDIEFNTLGNSALIEEFKNEHIGNR